MPLPLGSGSSSPALLSLSCPHSCPHLPSCFPSSPAAPTLLVLPEPAGGGMAVGQAPRNPPRLGQGQPWGQPGASCTPTLSRASASPPRHWCGGQIKLFSKSISSVEKKIRQKKDRAERRDAPCHTGATPSRAQLGLWLWAAPQGSGTPAVRSRCPHPLPLPRCCSPSRGSYPPPPAPG